jgi:hypothetical protein
MALHYQTEYRLGNRGRVCRSYTGFQALVAIFFDLIFGLLFEVVSMAIGVAVRIVALTAQLAVEAFRGIWKLLVSAMTVIVYLVTLPFAILHDAVDRLRSTGQPERPVSRAEPTAIRKPSWALGREV